MTENRIKKIYGCGILTLKCSSTQQVQILQFTSRAVADIPVATAVPPDL